MFSHAVTDEACCHIRLLLRHPHRILYIKTPACGGRPTWAPGLSSRPTLHLAAMGKVQQQNYNNNNNTGESKSEFSLEKVKGTWKRCPAKKANTEASECVSAAKMWVHPHLCTYSEMHSTLHSANFQPLFAKRKKERNGKKLISIFFFFYLTYKFLSIKFLKSIHLYTLFTWKFPPLEHKKVSTVVNQVVWNIIWFLLQIV